MVTNLTKLTCGRAAPLSLLLLALCNVGHARYPDCGEVAETLASQRWKNFETGSFHSYAPSGENRGIRTVNIKGTFKAKYALSTTRLMDDGEVKLRVCIIEISFLDNECIGDVHTYYVEKIGDSIRFRTSFGEGGKIWHPSSIVKRCEDEYETYSITPF